MAVLKWLDFEKKLSRPIFESPKKPLTKRKSPFLAPPLGKNWPWGISPNIVIVMFICFKDDVKS